MNNKLENTSYVHPKTLSVSCDGDMTSSIDGHPRVYMSFSNKKSDELYETFKGCLYLMVNKIRRYLSSLLFLVSTLEEWINFDVGIVSILIEVLNSSQLIN